MGKFKTEFDEKRQQFELEKAAKEIIDKKKELSKSSSSKGRWPIELIQNAIDSGGGRSSCFLKISCRQSDQGNILEFQHNAGPFDFNDLYSLITQTSRKWAKEPLDNKSPLGKFGTGFLTTLLFEHRATVQGVYVKQNPAERYEFEFDIDRRPETIPSMAAKIKESLDQLDASMRLIENSKTEVSTTFCFPLSDEAHYKEVLDDLQSIQKYLPLLLVFVKPIESIELTLANETIKFYREEENPCSETDRIIRVIRQEGNGPAMQSAYVLLSDKNGSQIDIAIPVDAGAGKTKIDICDASDIPLFYYPLPLLGTSQFPLSFSINCPDFDLTHDRRMIYLNKKDHANTTGNFSILKQATQLFLEWVASHSQNYGYSLFLINSGDSSNFTDNEFEKNIYEKEILNVLIKGLSEKLSMTTLSGNQKILKDICWPNPEQEPKGRDDLYLYYSRLSQDDILPSEQHKIMNNRDYKFKTKILHLEVFCEKLQLAGEIKKLPGDNDEDKLKLFNDMLEFLYNWKYINSDYENFIRKYRLFPNSDGVFRSCFELFQYEFDADLYDIYSSICNDLGEQPGIAKKSLVFGGFNKNLAASVLSKKTYEELGIDRLVGKWREKNIFSDGIRRFFVWMKTNPELAKKYFLKLWNDIDYLSFISQGPECQQVIAKLSCSDHIKELGYISDLFETGSLDPQRVYALVGEESRKASDEEKKQKQGEIIQNKVYKLFHEFNRRFDDNGQDIIVEHNGRSYYIEIKSTRNDCYVEMTFAQAEKATKNCDNYALCVVTIEEGITADNLDDYEIKDKCYFNTEIGKKLKNYPETCQEIFKQQCTIPDERNPDTDSIFLRNHITDRNKIRFVIGSGLCINARCLSLDEFKLELNQKLFIS